MRDSARSSANAGVAGSALQNRGCRFDSRRARQSRTAVVRLVQSQRIIAAVARSTRDSSRRPFSRNRAFILHRLAVHLPSHFNLAQRSFRHIILDANARGYLIVRDTADILS